MKPRRCTVRIFDKKGFVSELNLDSSKYDNIGFTQESLDKYMQNYLHNGQRTYYVVKDNYMKAWGKRLQEENLKAAKEHREEVRVQREEYTVIQNSHLGYLIKHTNEYIKRGWRPQGGICIQTSKPFPFEYYQALIRSV